MEVHPIGVGHCRHVPTYLVGPVAEQVFPARPRPNRVDVDHAFVLVFPCAKSAQECWVAALVLSPELAAACAAGRANIACRGCGSSVAEGHERYSRGFKTNGKLQ